jgi:stage II sporulation protein GA (sporulation sigma-E factor processing peptidase)
MEIIIEYVLIDNLVIDFLILYLSCKILKQKIVYWRLILSAVIGAGCALIIPIINLPEYLMIILKLILGIVMVLICLPCSTFKKSFISFLTFLMMTGCMGGVCFLIIFMLSGNMSFNFNISYSYKIPVGAIVFVCALVAGIISQLIKLIYRKKALNNFIYEITLVDKGKEIRSSAYLDSGNTLIDPVTNKPVIIINYSLFNKLYNLPLEKILTKKIKEEDIKKSHYITFNTIGKKSDMLVFEIDKMAINSQNQEKQFDNVLLGLSFSKLNNTFSCEALLNPQFIC